MNPFQTLWYIVEHHQAMPIHGVPVDTQTARAMLLIYRKLNGDNQDKFIHMLQTKRGLGKLANFAWARVG